MNRKSIICIILCTLFLDAIHAQPKSIGSTFSYAGIGLVYEHGIDATSFAEVQLRMETAPIFTYREFKYGATASFTWNMEFAEIESHDGDRVVFFAGSGAVLGFTEDLLSRRGLMAGLKGRIGAECTFDRKISLSLSVSPVIGVHLGLHEGMLNMLLYKMGLLYTLMPEIGVKYAF